MTEETKREILRDYENKEISVASIADKFHVSRSAIAKIAVEMGGQPRRQNAFGKKRGGKCKVCPKCKKTVDVKGARFCCYCGADIRNHIDILIERNERLLKISGLLPQNERDEFRDVLIANIKELQGVNK